MNLIYSTRTCCSYLKFLVFLIDMSKIRVFRKVRQRQCFTNPRVAISTLSIIPSFGILISRQTVFSQSNVGIFKCGCFLFFSIQFQIWRRRSLILQESPKMQGLPGGNGPGMLGLHRNSLVDTADDWLWLPSVHFGGLGGPMEIGRWKEGDQAMKSGVNATETLTTCEKQ